MTDKVEKFEIASWKYMDLLCYHGMVSEPDDRHFGRI
jgi:hypothetical protein